MFLFLSLGIDEDSYQKAFADSAAGRETVIEHFTEGRSGSFFYFTADRGFIVKTVSSDELLLLRDNVSNLLEHFKNNPQSLINRFCGLHSIRLRAEQQQFHFVVMVCALCFVCYIYD